MRVRLGLVVVLLALAGLVPTPARAKYRDVGTLDAARPHVSWSGTLLVPTSPLDCLAVKREPLCDHTDVRLDARGGDVEFVLTPDNAGDQISFYAYGPDGNLAGQGASLSSTERFVLDGPDPGVYDIRVHPLLALNGAGYHVDIYLRPPDTPVDLDPGPCDTATSLATIGAISAPGVPEIEHTPLVADDGRTVSLDIHVLLDGVAQADAAETLAKVAAPYALLGITVRAAMYEPFAVDTFEAADIIQAARAHFGGRRPAGSDLVLVITSKDITALGLNVVAGQADCIGGLADPRRAFMVAEGAGQGAEIVPDFAAKTTAHEMGHLLGGQHHFANCVEGIDLSNLLAFTPCTLMFNDVSLFTMRFSTVNGLIVRGYALKYASG
jgi:predicted Zn-dependent protease